MEYLKNPYQVSPDAIDELHRRSHAKEKRLFPNYPPCEIIRRTNRELEALWDSPATNGLLIAAQMIDHLRSRGVEVYLTGDWECSYYVWLMDLTKNDPRQLGASFQKLIHDGIISAPIRIEVAEEKYKKRCSILLKQYAEKWGFYLHPEKENTWRLISAGYRPDDIYARYAPVVEIV